MSINIFSRRTNLGIIGVLLILLAGCQVNSSNENEESEKIKAEKVTDKFYSMIADKNFEKADAFFSADFFKISTKEQLHQILSKTNATLGNYQSKKLADWKTKRTFGSKPFSEYVLVYEVKYEHFTAMETITLVSSDNSSIKILGYHINSDGFFK